MKSNLSLLTVLTALIAGCSPHSPNSGSGEKQAQADPAATKCLDGLRVCVGDSLIVMPNQLPLIISGQETVTELVSRGQLSQSEQKELNASPDWQRPTLERMLRSDSQDNGPRIMTQQKVYLRQDFNTLFASKGCVAPNSGCVGDKVTTWQDDDHAVYGEEIVGLALQINGDTPLLVRETTALLPTKLAEIKTLSAPIETKGCVTTSEWNHAFCVGETYQLGSGASAQLSSVEVTVVNVAPQFAVLQDSEGAQLVIPQDQHVYDIFSESGCVSGATDVCLPQLAHQTVIAATAYSSRATPYLTVDKQTDAVVLGVVIPRTEGPQVSDRILATTTRYGTQILKIGASDYLLFHKNGCTNDGKICAGQSYPFKFTYEQQTENQTFTVTGVNAANNQVIGSIPVMQSALVLSPADLTVK